jgi:hypothetical protein
MCCAAAGRLTKIPANTKLNTTSLDRVRLLTVDLRTCTCFGVTMAQPITPCPYLIEENAISTSMEASPTATVLQKTVVDWAAFFLARL